MIINIANNIKETLLFLKVDKTYHLKPHKPWRLSYTFIPLVLLITLVFLYLDTPIESQIIEISPDVIAFFKAITHIGKPEFIFILCLFILGLHFLKDPYEMSEAFRQRTNQLIFLTVSVLGSGFIGLILKLSIGRARPIMFEEHGAFYFNHFQTSLGDFASMPSGHSTTLGSLFVSLFFIFPRLKYLWIVIALVLALSRVLVRAHYPSDIIFGLALGSYTAVYCYYWFKNRQLVA